MLSHHCDNVTQNFKNELDQIIERTTDDYEVEQLLELKPQDIILPESKGATDEGAHKVFFRVTKFIDNLLVKFYRLPPFYNLKKEKDIVGHFQR